MDRDFGFFGGVDVKELEVLGRSYFKSSVLLLFRFLDEEIENYVFFENLEEEKFLFVLF